MLTIRAPSFNRRRYILCVPARGIAPSHAEVAELADALASGASGRKVIGVQIPASAPFFKNGSFRPFAGVFEK